MEKAESTLDVAHVLIREEQYCGGDPLCVSRNMDTLMDCAQAENLEVDCRPLSDVGSFVPIEDGYAMLHIERTVIR